MGPKIRTNISESRFTADLHQIVTAAGGEWLGIQECLLTDVPSQIMVRNPATRRVLSVPFNPCTFDTTALYVSICQRIGEDTPTNASKRVAGETVTIKVETLAKIAKMILELSQEIDALGAGSKE